MKKEKIISKILKSSKYRGIYRPTVERIVDNYYSKIFEITGIPGVLFDSACGLNALTFLGRGKM